MGLLTIRWFSKKDKQKIAIPDLAKPYLMQIGWNPNTLEQVASSVWIYWDLYNFFMNDLYVILFIMGLVIFTSQVAFSYGYC